MPQPRQTPVVDPAHHADRLRPVADDVRRLHGDVERGEYPATTVTLQAAIAADRDRRASHLDRDPRSVWAVEAHGTAERHHRRAHGQRRRRGSLY